MFHRPIETGGGGGEGWGAAAPPIFAKDDYFIW